MLSKLSQPEYQHILLNHLPLTGLAVAVAVTVTALVIRNRPATLIGLALVALLSAAVWPVTETGQSAYNRVRPLADEAGQRALRQHMELADAWSKLYFASAAVAALAFVVVWRKPSWMGVVSVLALLLAMASLVAGAVIAESGGRIRHPEFRAGPPAALEAAQAESR